MLYWNALPVRLCALDLPFLSPWHDIYIMYAREKWVDPSSKEGGLICIVSWCVALLVDGRSNSALRSDHYCSAR